METQKITFWSGFIQTVKRFWYRYVVITLLLSLVAGIWLEWREEQASAVSRVEAAYGAVQSRELQWLNASSALVAAASQPEASYPSRQSLTSLELEVRQTLDLMTSFYTPTDRIEASSRAYKNALLDISGAINQYRANDEGLSRVFGAIETASELGEEFKRDITDYRTNAWRSFLSIIV